MAAYVKVADRKKQTPAPVAPVVPETVVQPLVTDDDLLSPSTDTPVATGPDAPPATPGMYLTHAMLAEIVASAVGAATSAVNKAGNQAIADSISQALTQHMGPRRLTIADIGEPKTPFNPEGKKREMKCDFYQNGYPIQERFVSDDEIELLHQLVPGSFGTPEFPIAVIEKKRLSGKNRVFILHPDGKDDRLKIKNYAPSFHGVLVKLVQEAKDQKAERRREARALLADE